MRDQEQRRNRVIGLAGSALVLALVTGCDRGQVQAYRAPKDAIHTNAMAGAGMGGMDAHPPMPGRLRWTLPAGWQELPAGQMRVGHFAIAGSGDQKAQVTIIPLAGMGGGDLENVNRWRSQVGQPRITQEEYQKLAEPVDIAGEKASLFDFVGVPPEEDQKTRLLGAIAHRQGTAWFFKAVGDEALLAAQKPVFIEFLKSVRFEGGGEVEGGPGVAGGGAVPAPAPAAEGRAQPPASGGGGSAAPAGWKVPAGWRQEGPGAMQMARFVAGEGEAKAEISVAVLPGEAGGVLANVNRWRGQIGLGPVTEAELAKLVTSVEAEGAKGYVVDLGGEGGGRRMVAAGLSRGGQTWFYKLTGGAAAVGREKEAFLKFIRGGGHGA